MEFESPADRLKENNINRTATLIGNKIQLSFDYDMGVIQVVKNITGRRWNPDKRVWTLPKTSWHCNKVQEVLLPLGFDVSQGIMECSDAKATIPILEYPEGMYEFQKRAVDFIASTGGRCIVADEMGTGKTIEALGYASLFSSKVLIIAPANVIYKWEGECQTWMKDKTIAVYPTGKGEMGKEDVHIMSYGIMASRYEELRNIPYDTIIFDEAHMVKNSKAIRTRVSKALVKAGIQSVLFLSGTPFMNRPSELFPLLNMLDPVSYNNFYQYAMRYCGMQMHDGVAYFPPGVVTNRDELAERLSRVMIRRTKREVLKDLPDLTRTTIPIEISNMSAYKAAVKDIRDWLKSKDKEVLNPDHQLTRLGALRQILAEGKVPAAVELAEAVLQDGKQVVLFCHHKEIVTSLANALKSHGVDIIDGSVKPEKRFEKTKLFLSPDSSIRVMIITTAGREGIDLYSASDIIFVEREWVPAWEEQAESRLHRNGQKNPVNAYYLAAKKTADEKMDKMVREKRKVVGSVISQDEVIEVFMSNL